MFHKKVLDFQPRREEVFAFEGGADVICDIKGCLFFEDVFYIFAGCDIARINNREGVCLTKTGTGIGGGDEFCHFNNMCHGSAIGSAGQENHIGTEASDAGYFLVRQASIIGCKDVHDNGSCAKGGALGAFRRHGFHRARHKHLKSASRAGCRDIDINAFFPVSRMNDFFAIKDFASGEFLNFLKCIEDTAGDVIVRFFNGCGRFASEGLAVFTLFVFFDKDGFGCCASAICCNYYIKIFCFHWRLFLKQGVQFAMSNVQCHHGVQRYAQGVPNRLWAKMDRQ